MTQHFQTLRPLSSSMVRVSRAETLARVRAQDLRLAYARVKTGRRTVKSESEQDGVEVRTRD